MRVMANIKQYSFDVKLSLQRLGERIATARKSRQLRQDDAATMAGISRSTYIEIEKGSPHVEIGNYVSVLWALNLMQDLDHVASPATDIEAQSLATSNLPRRVRP
jgi:DNA-binding XRE family transcriptional regulator